MRRRVAIAGLLSLLASWYAAAQGTTAGSPSPISVEDLARFATIGDPGTLHEDYWGDPPTPGLFSPDGARVAVIVRRGNIDLGTNDASLLIYRTSELLNTSQPLTVAEFSSASNRQPMADLRWLKDSQSLVFAGARAEGNTQLFRVNVGTREVTELTPPERQLASYAISKSEQQLITLYEPLPVRPADDVQCRQRGCRVTADMLWFADNTSSQLPPPMTVTELRTGQSRQIPSPQLSDRSLDSCDPQLLGEPSPDGRFALRTCRVRQQPEAWKEYTATQESCPTPQWCFTKLFLIDLQAGTAHSLTEAPSVLQPAPVWIDGGQRAILQGMYESVSDMTGAERARRAKTLLTLLLDPETRTLKRIEEERVRREIKAQAPRQARRDIDLVVEQSLNDRPVLYAVERKGGNKSGRKVRILDPNAWLSQRQLAHVELLKWNVPDGTEFKGTLYYPPDYRKGLRYPLVLQTHGMQPDTFSLTGVARNFPGQALAAHDIVVLQMAENVADVALGPAEWPRVQSAYEAVIDQLDGSGLIDRKRVGIIGWSRTAVHLGYMLTHSTYPIAASAITSGADIGWLYYLEAGAPAGELDQIYGAAPYGAGLEAWLEHSATFNLPRVQTPMLMWSELTSAGLFDWYAGLRRLDKPVELWMLPTGAHDVYQIGQRIQTNQLLVDWFRFWLKDEEDSSGQRAEQYVRWREKRQQQDAVLAQPRPPLLDWKATAILAPSP